METDDDPRRANPRRCSCRGDGLRIYAYYFRDRHVDSKPLRRFLWTRTEIYPAQTERNNCRRKTMTHNEQLMADWCVGCKERIGSSQITSILPSEIPDWAWVLITITAIVLMLAR